jgi:hypothetical protein
MKRDVLELFRQRVEELRNTRFVKNFQQLKINLTFNEKVGFDYKFENEPDEDDLRSFLLTFRQFISNDEPVFLNKIYNALQIKLSDQALKVELIKSRKRFKSASSSADLQLIIGEETKSKGKKDIEIKEVITPELITKILLNARYFHNDEEKAEKIKRFEKFEDWGKGMFRYNFIQYLIKVTNEIFFIDAVVKEASNRSLWVS